MRPLRYSINLTLDGCCDHTVMPADAPHLEELHRHAAHNLLRADALLLGRVTYQMMESAFRQPALPAGQPRPAWNDPGVDAFAVTIDAMPKHVVTRTLERVDWNAERVQGDIVQAVRQLKQQPGRGLFTGGVQLPLLLARAGLIDEYEFILHPRLAGRGPRVFEGLSQVVDLQLAARREFASGALGLRYEPRR